MSRTGTVETRPPRRSARFRSATCWRPAGRPEPGAASPTANRRRGSHPARPAPPPAAGVALTQRAACDAASPARPHRPEPPPAAQPQGRRGARLSPRNPRRRRRTRPPLVPEPPGLRHGGRGRDRGRAGADGEGRGAEVHGADTCERPDWPARPREPREVGGADADRVRRVGGMNCQNPPSRRVRAGGDAVEGCPRTLAGPPTGAVRRRFSASSAAEDTPPRSARPLGEVGECLTLPRTPAPSARTRASVCALWAVPWARGHAPRAGG